MRNMEDCNSDTSFSIISSEDPAIESRSQGVPVGGVVLITQLDEDDTTRYPAIPMPTPEGRRFNYTHLTYSDVQRSTVLRVLASTPPLPSTFIKCEGIMNWEILALVRVLRLRLSESTQVIRDTDGAPAVLSSKEWGAAMRLAVHWSFEEQRPLLSNLMEKMITDRNPYEWLHVRHTETTSPSLLLAYRQILYRLEPLTSYEASSFGWEKAMAIVRLREKCFRTFGGQPSSYNAEQHRETEHWISTEGLVPKCERDLWYQEVVESAEHTRHALQAETETVKVAVQRVDFYVPLASLKGSAIVRWEDGASVPSRVELNKDITPEDFERFLKVADARWCDGELRLTFSEWTSALRVSTAIIQDELSSFILTAMTPQVPEQKPQAIIEAGIAGGITEWIEQGAKDLVQGREPPTAIELAGLGPEIIIKIYSEREMNLREKLKGLITDCNQQLSNITPNYKRKTKGRHSEVRYYSYDEYGCKAPEMSDALTNPDLSPNIPAEVDAMVAM